MVLRFRVDRGSVGIRSIVSSTYYKHLTLWVNCPTGWIKPPDIPSCTFFEKTSSTRIKRYGKGGLLAANLACFWCDYLVDRWPEQSLNQSEQWTWSNYTIWSQSLWHIVSVEVPVDWVKSLAKSSFRRRPDQLGLVHMISCADVTL